MVGNTIIPSSERQLIEASVGDVVKISYQGSREPFESAWTILYSKDWRHKGYCFIVQEKAKGSRDVDIVLAHTSPLNTIQFDRNFWAILNHLYHENHFISPQREEYDEMTCKLRAENMWY